jgi:phosphate uptake regulator
VRTIIPSPELEDMARRARQMLSDALDAFVKADGQLGREVCAADDAVDSLQDSIFRVMLTHMMADTAHHQERTRAAAGEPQHRADRRSRHQRR